MEQPMTYETIDQYLAQWSQYINPEDFAILREFTYNTANNIPFDKLLIFCGPGGEGKTTLVNELFSLIGKDNCVYEELIYKSNNKNKKASLIIPNHYYTKKLMAYNYDCSNYIYDDTIKYILTRTPILSREPYRKAEYHSPTANLILVANDISKLNEELLMSSYVINFTHKF